jgi:tRNA pseudouridine55 synthase
LQNHFRSSTLFAPLLERQCQQAYQDRKRAKWKQRAAGENIKIGHGGTLDPLATGVLVVGVGKGTKQMNTFLGGTKSYETVVLFGKGTDTYDVAGKIVASAPFQHITRDMVEGKLAAFRGKIQQAPPMYSALKVDGMKAYDYARTGKQLPRELEARGLEVEECDLVEWFEGGKHDFRWPATEASKEDKKVATSLMVSVKDEARDATTPQKRKLMDLLDGEDSRTSATQTKQPKVETEENASNSESNFLMKQEGTLPKNCTIDPSAEASSEIHDGLSAAEKAKLHTHEIGPLSTEASSAPAARIRVTASSGFYVRSFAHDLGIACGSLALMATLLRSRQSEFYLSSALTYDDLEGGEKVWGPKVREMLEHWNQRQPEEPRINDRDRPESLKNRSWKRGGGEKQKPDTRTKGSRDQQRRSRERRNTSSAEE